MQNRLLFLITVIIGLFVKGQSIDFKWEKDSINGKLVDKIAMSVPFTIENKTYRFQFDLGANTTLIYDKCFEKTEFIKNKKVEEAMEAAGHKVFTVDHQNFSVGKLKIENYKLNGLLNFEQEEACGVVGADLFQNKYLIIDFPNQKITVSEQLKTTKKIDLVDIKIINNKPILPVEIDGKVYHFQYDTGASIFPIVSYKKNFQDLIDSSKIIENFNIRNFNNPLVVKAIETNKNVIIGKSSFSTKEFWFTDEDYFSFEQQGLDGVMGNVFFLDKTIVIDFKNKKFGIII
ncbi:MULTISPECIES: aspartyl protease family protein [Chryseobacterium group]|uniref:Aspartyl protease n=1 Tax=Chryseobacterium arachidis TaxID=1416778 RepID=A0A1M5KNS4_9FLAO|nr:MULTISPECIES: aspartyl protease family protein [Chryseobacterium group]UQB68536.1 aspartyl protease family protein [Epilithonimonas zeae]SHG53823.1 Aspartyl protease [Chryseobacterium arachidis]